MNAEFGSVGAFMCEYPQMVMLAERRGVTVTALSPGLAREWAKYVLEAPQWKDIHVASGYPVSSLFRGAYTSLEAYSVSVATWPRYLKMLEELTNHGEVHIIEVLAPQW